MALTYRKLWVAVGWAMVVLVLYLSLTPNPPAPLTFDNADKVEHVMAYAGLSFWFFLLYPSAQGRLIMAVALVGLGVGLEYVQGWTGYRTFDVLDMAADAVGVLTGWLLVCTPLGRLLAHIDNRIGTRPESNRN